MKKALSIFTFTLLLAVSGSAQKKANGTIYLEHPAINTVRDFIRAFIAGDEEKMKSFMAPDFRSYSGTSKAYADSGIKAASFLATNLRFSKEFDHLSMDELPGTYPDAIEYTKDNKEQEVWVQTWVMLRGVHKITGVKLDAAALRLFKLTKDNKIKAAYNYNNASIFDELALSYSSLLNGKIYSHHENINTVRKLVYAFEKGEIDKALVDFDDKATFSDVNDAYGTNWSKADMKTGWTNFHEKFEVKAIEQIGYPDYLEYDLDAGREVISWWKFQLVRKSDKKKILLPVHLSIGFDEKGKMISFMEYYNGAALTNK